MIQSPPNRRHKKLATLLRGLAVVACFLFLTFLGLRGLVSRATRQKLSRLRELPTHPISPQKAPAGPKGRPVAELPFCGAFFSADPVAEATWLYRHAPVYNLKDAISTCRRQSIKGNRSRTKQMSETMAEFLNRVDFNTLLRQLGRRPPADQSQPAAAADFLKATEAASSALAGVQSDATQPWDWSAALDQAENAAWSPFFYYLVEMGQIHAVLAKARALAGDWKGAEAEVRAILCLASRLGEAAGYQSSLSQATLVSMAADVRRDILRNGGWTDDQLAAMLPPFPRPSLLDISRQGLEHLAVRQERTALRLPDFRDAEFNFLRKALTSEAALVDCLTYRAELYRHLAGQITPDGIWHPYPPGWDAALVLANRGPWNPLNLGAAFLGQDESSRLQGSLRRAVINETRRELLRVRAALELYRRKNGSLPDNLEALTPLFPAGPPLDPATSGPLHFTKTATEVKLWGEHSEANDLDPR